MQRLVASRALVLLGDLDGAWRAIHDVPPELADVAALVRAEVATRPPSRLRERSLRSTRPAAPATPSSFAPEQTRCARISRDLGSALHDRGAVREVSLTGIERASSGDAFLLDACRRLVRAGRATVRLARRPVPFDTLLALATRWPEGVDRDELAPARLPARAVRTSAAPRPSPGSRSAAFAGLLAGIATLSPARTGYALSSPAPGARPLAADGRRDGARLGTAFPRRSARRGPRRSSRSTRASRSERGSARSALTRRGRPREPDGPGQGETRYATRAGHRIASRMLLLGLVPAS